MRSFITALLVSVSFATAATAVASPFKIVTAKSELKDNSKIIYKQGDVAISAAYNASTSDYEDLYAVRIPHFNALPAEIATLGEVIELLPKEVAILRIPMANVDKISGFLHHQGLSCGVLESLTNRPVTETAVATPTPIIPVETAIARVSALTAQVGADNIKGWIEMLAEIETRHHDSDTGRGIAELLSGKYADLANGREDVTISSFSHSRTSQDSLVVRIEGQSTPHEVIVLGSHIDSINSRGTRSPGADDNASGTATNLEIFRILMANNIRLNRTLEIHGYAAEEIGLVGSKEIAAKYRDQSINVVAMVQHDMNLYKAPGTEDKIWFVSNSTNSGLNSLLEKLSTNYSGIAHGSAYLFGGSSDHASWNREGFAAAFPFENPSKYNNNIHTSNDTIENSGAFTQAAGFAKLGLGYVTHFGGIL